MRRVIITAVVITLSSVQAARAGDPTSCYPIAPPSQGPSGVAVAVPPPPPPVDVLRLPCAATLPQAIRARRRPSPPVPGWLKVAGAVAVGVWVLVALGSQ